MVEPREIADNQLLFTDKNSNFIWFNLNTGTTMKEAGEDAARLTKEEM